MHKLLPLLVLLLAFVGDACFAQANAELITCELCRDPHEYPEDYANFAFNQVFGPESWMTPTEADDFFVTNGEDGIVYVDIDFIFLGIGIEGLRLPFWPTNFVKITLALPNGTIVETIRSVFLTPLPVPASNDNADSDSGGSPGLDGDGGNGDEGDDDYVDEDPFDWDELEIDEPVGIVEIEDPDEYGDFGDTEWCEEC